MFRRRRSRGFQQRQVSYESEDFNRGRKMWQLIAIVLAAVLLFYWLSFMFTIWCWLQVIFCLCQLQFVRATIWFSLGSGMLFWWFDKDIDFDTWLHGSAVIVSIGALGTFVRFYRRHQRAVEAVPPYEPAPFEPAPVVNININICPSPHADRHAVHDDLAALASALRTAIGAEQGPRRISGPTIID